MLYKFNDWIESMGVEKIFIRHTSKVRDEISVQKIEEKDKQFLIGKYSKDREPEIVLKIEKNYRVRRKQTIKTNYGNVKDTYEFLKKPSDEDDFECEIVEDILKDEPCEHKKVETPYVEPTLQDAATADDQIKKEIDDFLQLTSEINKVNLAATIQKKVDFYDKLFKDIQGKPDRRQKIDDAITTEDIFTESDLFSDNDPQDILDFVDKIRSEIDTDDILFEHEPVDATSSVQVEPELRFDFTDILFKENNKSKCRTAEKIREKYLKMGRNRDKVKKSAQRAIRQPEKSKYLETDDTETVEHSNGINRTDVNDDLSSDAETIIYEEPIIKNPMQHFDTKKFMKNMGDGYDVQFIQQVLG